jgi:hypothetical protein
VPLDPHLGALLRRVVLEVFDTDVEVTWDDGPRARHQPLATLRRGHGAEGRTVNLSASATGWFEISVPDLGVGAWLIEYDDAHEMEAILRDFALVARAYLSGAGRIEHRRGIFRTRPVLVLPVEGREWILGRRSGGVREPEDPPSRDDGAEEPSGN